LGILVLLWSLVITCPPNKCNSHLAQSVADVSIDRDFQRLVTFQVQNLKSISCYVSYFKN